MGAPQAKGRDYSLVGREAQLAVDKGLASAQWYACPVSRKRLKELMQRSDSPALRDTVLWVLSFLITGGLAFYLWPSWLALPFFLAYGVLYGSSSDRAGMNADIVRLSRPVG